MCIRCLFRDVEKDPDGYKLCAQCGRQSYAGEKLMKCSRCNLAFYCNRECQKIHWHMKQHGHKDKCVEITGSDDGRLKFLFDLGCGYLSVNYVSKFEKLISANPALSSYIREKNGATANILHACVHYNSLEGLTYLFNSQSIDDISVSLEAVTETRPLHMACESGFVELVKFLLDRQEGDVNRTIALGYTPLILASWKRQKEVVEILLDLGADVNYLNECEEDEDQMYSALHGAYYHGSMEIIQMLLDRQADVNLQCPNLPTPLHMSCEQGNLDVVRMLLDHHADVNLLTRDDYACKKLLTPLDVARSSGHEEVVELLVKYSSSTDGVVGTGGRLSLQSFSSMNN